MASNDLPRRENKDQRKANQAAAARTERVKQDSFSVPDRFAARRESGATEGYTHERD